MPADRRATSTADDVDGHRVHLRNPANDAYDLDGNGNIVDDGIGCESF